MKTLWGRHIPEPAGEKVRGSAQEPAKQNSQSVLRRGRLESGGPFCHPGLFGASGAIWTPASVRPRINPLLLLRRSHGQREASSLLSQSELLSPCHLLFCPPLSSPHLHHHHQAFRHLYCCSSAPSLPSLPFWGIADTVWKPGNRQLPRYYAAFPPLRLCPCSLSFWQDTGCQQRL